MALKHGHVEIFILIIKLIYLPSFLNLSPRQSVVVRDDLSHTLQISSNYSLWRRRTQMSTKQQQDRKSVV